MDAPNPQARRFGDMKYPALCPERASQLAVPSTGRLPSTLSATDLSSVLFEKLWGGRREASQVPTRSLHS
jgi:hypothetical protein